MSGYLSAQCGFGWYLPVTIKAKKSGKDYEFEFALKTPDELVEFAERVFKKNFVSFYETRGKKGSRVTTPSSRGTSASGSYAGSSSSSRPASASSGIILNEAKPVSSRRAQSASSNRPESPDLPFDGSRVQSASTNNLSDLRDLPFDGTRPAPSNAKPNLVPPTRDGKSPT